MAQSNQLTLYSHPGSPYVRAILSLLYDADIQFTEQFVDIMKGEQNTEEYKAINPFCKVPAIKDGNFALYESTAILRYICRSRGLTKYYPENDFAKVAAVDRLFGLSPQSFEQTVGKVVYLRLFAPLRGITANEEEIQKLMQEGTSNIQKFETLLTSSFLAGEELTIADMYLFAVLSQPVLLISLDLAPFPKIKAWYERVAACKGPAKGLERFKEAIAAFQAAQQAQQASKQ